MIKGIAFASFGLLDRAKCGGGRPLTLSQFRFSIRCRQDRILGKSLWAEGEKRYHAEYPLTPGTEWHKNKAGLFLR